MGRSPTPPQAVGSNNAGGAAMIFRGNGSAADDRSDLFPPPPGAPEPGPEHVLTQVLADCLVRGGGLLPLSCSDADAHTSTSKVVAVGSGSGGGASASVVSSWRATATDAGSDRTPGVGVVRAKLRVVGPVSSGDTV
jgi:hypothetical protein